MLRSLRARLLMLVILLVAAMGAAGFVMVGLFHQSATARIGQADAQVGRACDAIAEAYRFYVSGWKAGAALDDESFRRGLPAVVEIALRQRAAIEGGLWQRSAGSLAYAYPTYEGSGRKTDLPQAELPMIRSANNVASSEEHATQMRHASASQTLLIAACPLPGPVPELSAWTMTRVGTFAGSAYRQLMSGLAILLISVFVATLWLLRLTLTWSRHVAGIQATLTSHDINELPTLRMTGERELDLIVGALNDAGVRLAQTRRRTEELSRRMAAAERMAAIGRIAGGVAHEIRNPIAAMRLKAENALARGGDRYEAALTVILSQIERLERLLGRMLNATGPETPELEKLDLATFLEGCVSANRELAAARGLKLTTRTEVDGATLDPELIRRALDNLLHNAIQAAPGGSRVELAARVSEDRLILSVHDAGSGPPVHIREHLFEPFVTGRADGTGLGLSIVREIAEAHGGTAHCRSDDSGTSFEMVLPWRTS